MLRTLVLLASTAACVCADVEKPSPELIKQFSLPAFYKKVVRVEDFPVVSSDQVPDAALEEAAHNVRQMLDGREDILHGLAKNKVRLTVMAVSERTCDVPEHSDLKPAAFWNRRARGLGASTERPCVSCGEENLLHNPGDPYSTESIMVHEFAHAIHQMGLSEVDPTFDTRLQEAYRHAMDKGLWKGLYAAENHYEYWAEAVQSWFDTNRENDALHNHVNSRQELIDYDPDVAALCREVFGDRAWRYVRADDPSRLTEPHLKDLDRSKLAPFAWTKQEEEDYRKNPEPK
ncbi:hypothetical protein HNR46_001567 [Haloferula luteola]|uniref:Uncharacterized protein n=1 Tax=Haloferula luteola TaxID=595692 RepID=A0A840VET6_9BACT|nr:hypothetical protein [Haloferula luteola]MBB5351331.1 hypothetical protein [Haloferula luteola]